MGRRQNMVGLVVWLGLLVVLAHAPGATARAVAREAPLSVSACTDAAYDLIGMVNGVRTGAGLAPFEVHGTLMAVAQAHSEYQASIGQGTHTGPGGSRPADRVKAAGYGGGRPVYVSENIAWGYHLTPQGALEMWIPSPPHYRTMTGPLYHDVGAGCARQGDRVYYTLVAAGISGQGPAPTPRPTTNPPEERPTSTPLPPPTPTLPYEPVLPATPRPDGAVIHTVRRGQTLMMIAGSYRVPLEDILRYNHLTENSLLRIGQEIIIVPPQVTETPTASASATPPAASPTVVSTAEPTSRAASHRADATPSPPPSASATPSFPLPADAPTRRRYDRLLDAALATGLTLALGGYAWSRRRRD